MPSERGHFFTLETSVTDSGLLAFPSSIRQKHAKNADLRLKRLLAVISNSEQILSGFLQPDDRLVKMIDLRSGPALCATVAAE